MKIIISTESTCDLSPELIKENDIRVIPFTVLLGEDIGYDGEITPQIIFDYVEKTGILPKTSAINEFTYNEYFSNLRKECDAVIHISLSSQLSCSYDNARKAASTLDNVYVIDSKSLSTGIGLQVLYACSLRDKGLKAIDIVKSVEERRSNVQASFVVHTLSYLHKGGRCSGASRFLGGILRIKPQIIVNPEGKMEPSKKFIGRGVPVVKAYCEQVLANNPDPDKSLVFVTHSFATPEMVEAAKEVLRENGFSNIVETTAGATITSHCGPKTLGILFYNN